MFCTIDPARAHPDLELWAEVLDLNLNVFLGWLRDSVFVTKDHALVYSDTREIMQTPEYGYRRRASAASDSLSGKGSTALLVVSLIIALFILLAQWLVSLTNYIVWAMIFQQIIVREVILFLSADGVCQREQVWGRARACSSVSMGASCLAFRTSAIFLGCTIVALFWNLAFLPATSVFADRIS